jgi:hypothetical protein
VVAPVVLEEVEAVLAINSDHSDDVGRVGAVTEEL